MAIFAGPPNEADAPLIIETNGEITVLVDPLQAWFEAWAADQRTKGPAYFEAITKYQNEVRRLNTEEMLKGQAFGL